MPCLRGADFISLIYACRYATLLPFSPLAMRFFIATLFAAAAPIRLLSSLGSLSRAVLRFYAACACYARYDEYAILRDAVYACYAL